MKRHRHTLLVTAALALQSCFASSVVMTTNPTLHIRGIAQTMNCDHVNVTLLQDSSKTLLQSDVLKGNQINLGLNTTSDVIMVTQCFKNEEIIGIGFKKFSAGLSYEVITGQGTSSYDGYIGQAVPISVRVFPQGDQP